MQVAGPERWSGVFSGRVQLSNFVRDGLKHSYADHMFTGINLGLRSRFGIYLRCVLGLCYWGD